MVVILKNGFVTNSLVTNESSNNVPPSVQNGDRSDSSSNNQRCNFTDVNSDLRCNASTECRRKADKANFCEKHLRLITNWKRRYVLRNPVCRKSPFARNVSSQNGVNLDDYYDATDFRKPVELSNIPAEHAEIGFEDDEVLSHAGIYTTEEVVRITLEKLIKLRSEYVKCLKVLDRRLEIGVKLNAQKMNDDPSHDKKACSGYANNRRKEAFRALKLHGRISRRQRLLKKFRLDKKPAQCGIKSSCVFSDEDGTACQNESMVDSSYCKSHILRDSRQTLYVQCSQEGCCEIVLKVYDKCVGHANRS